MKTSVALVRSETDRRLPREILVPELKTSHRPVERFTGVRLNSKADVEKAVKARVPVYLLDPSEVAQLGYSWSFKPKLLVSKAFADAVESRFQKLVLRDGESLPNPTLEDLVVAMLKVNRLGARQMVRNNLSRLDKTRLLERVLVEKVLPLATRVRLNDFVPGLPVSGPALPKSELRREDAMVYSRNLES
jgi:hypothetical protein